MDSNQLKTEGTNIPEQNKDVVLDDWNKLKAHKIATGNFYTGPFATARGNPDFGKIPLITKYLFLIVTIYFIINKNYKYTIYALLCYCVGSILNAIRFYYVDSLASTGEDYKYLKSVVTDNIIGATLAFLGIIYIFFKKK
jgi:hypothetical protein